MTAPHPDHPGPALLAREARVRHGPIIRPAGSPEVPHGAMLIDGDSFLLRTGAGYDLFYRKGEGVTIERIGVADPADEELWLNGSTYAAIAAINGFMPFHASAVVWQGRVHAFTGPSGAGKSTLAAALGQHGLPLLCDDTLVLDLSGPGRILCLPGHKRLKLADDAFALTGARRREKVSAMVAKHYADPPGGILRQVLPLARMTWLDEGDTISIGEIIGAERIARLNDDHYTAQLHAQARGEDLAGRFARIAALAGRLPMERLVRPRDPARFAEVTAMVAARIKQDRAS